MGLPKALRSFMYPAASSMAPWAMPTAWAPMAGRLRSRVCMAMVKPMPSSPTRLAAGTRTSSKTTSAVGLPRRPILSSCGATLTPQSASTTKQLMPRRGRHPGR